MSYQDIPALHTDAVDRPGHRPGHGPQARIGTPVAALIAVLTSIIGLLVLGWAILFITKGRFLKHPFERITSNFSQRQVQVDGDFQLYFNPFNVKFYAEGMRVSNPDWVGQGYFFTARTIDTNIATSSLLFGKRRVNWLALDGAAINLEWDKNHRRNSWTFIGNAKPLELPLIKTAVIDGTMIRYRDPKMQLLADIAVRTIRAQGRQVMNAVRFSGSGVARRTPFTLYGALLSPNATIAGGNNQLALAISAARTRAEITGTLPGATELEGADLHIDVRGRNMGDLFRVGGIAVPDTRAYRLRSAMTKAGDEWRFTRLVGHFGESDLAGKFTIKMLEPRMLLTATLATRLLDIVDIAPFIGYDVERVAAKGGAGTVRQVNGTPRLLPDSPLAVEALKNFDADVRYIARSIRAKSLPVSNVALTLSLDNSLLKLSPLSFDVAQGHLASDIIINARKSPVFTDYDIRLSPTPMGRLLGGFGVEESGTTGTLEARIKMTGTGNSVARSLASADGRIAIVLPKGSFWTRNVQLAELDLGTFVYKMFEGKLKEPVQINCGLIGFTVRNGVAAADPILIDTSKSVMVGRGGFSFRNEAVDLSFRADGKRFSLLSGQSPVGVGGYFAKPGINVISSDLFLRGGAAVALGLVATPLASVLAFVDIGDAKSAACSPILSGATATAQRTSKGLPRDDVGRGTTAKSENGNSTRGQRKDQRKKFLGIF